VKLLVKVLERNHKRAGV